MSDIGYTVRVNGLFPEVKEPDLYRKKKSSTTNTASGLSRRIMGYTVQAEMEQFEQAMRDSFRDQLITGSSGVYVDLDPDGRVSISSTGNVAVGQSSLTSNTTGTYNTSVGAGTSLIDEIVPYQTYYNVVQSRLDTLIEEERDTQHEPTTNALGIVRTAYQVTGSEDRRRLVLNTLQRQLQQGEISVMDYLDLISQQE